MYSNEQTHKQTNLNQNYLSRNVVVDLRCVHKKHGSDLNNEIELGFCSAVLYNKS